MCMGLHWKIKNSYWILLHGRWLDHFGFYMNIIICVIPLTAISLWWA